MRKLIALLLALLLAVSLIACGDPPDAPVVDVPTDPLTTDAPTEEPTEPGAKVLTHDEFLAAPIDAIVTVVTNIQDVTERLDGIVQLYTQNAEGAYYIRDLACTEEDAFGVLNPGAKIQITGRKAESHGQVMIVDATYALLESVNDANFAAPVDVTDLARQGDDALIGKMNFWVTVKGLTVVASKDATGNDVPFLYKQDGSGSQGDDIYFKAQIGEQVYTFVVNTLMIGTGPQSEQYMDIEENLQIGDVITIECYLCWNNGAQPHITAAYPFGE